MGGGERMSDSSNLPLEFWIEHKTQSQPFSLHHIHQDGDDTSVLYIHCHREMEIFLLEQGSLTFFCGNKAFSLQEGEAIFLPPYVIHHAERTDSFVGPCSFYAMVFSSEALGNSIPPYCRSYLNQLALFCPEDVYPIYGTEKNREILATIGQIFQYTSRDMSTCELSLIGLLLKFWQELHNEFFARQTTARKNTAAAEYMRKAAGFIQQHYTEQLRLSDIARAASVSESCLCHSFREYTGFAPVSYINHLRIAKSCDYILNSSRSITEIAVLCGYNNISYFNRVFKNIMGTSPLAYKKATEAPDRFPGR